MLSKINVMKYKISEIWDSIKDQKPKDMHVYTWKQSYDGVKLALLQIGLVLEMTREEFGLLPVPQSRDGYRCYNNRKVVVSRQGNVSGPTRLHDLLTGQSALLTHEEKQALNSQNSERQKRKKLILISIQRQKLSML